MEGVVHKTTSFEEAANRDMNQQLPMTPQPRLEAAKVVRERGPVPAQSAICANGTTEAEAFLLLLGYARVSRPACAGDPDPAQ